SRVANFQRRSGQSPRKTMPSQQTGTDVHATPSKQFDHEHFQRAAHELAASLSPPAESEANSLDRDVPNSLQNLASSLRQMVRHEVVTVHITLYGSNPGTLLFSVLDPPQTKLVPEI